MTITLTRTSETDRHVVTNMFTAYFYDMDQHDDNLIINAHGLPMRDSSRIDKKGPNNGLGTVKD